MGTMKQGTVGVVIGEEVVGRASGSVRQRVAQCRFFERTARLSEPLDGSEGDGC